MSNQFTFTFYMLFIVVLTTGCGLPTASSTSRLKTGIHVTNLRYNEENLYFGAGYCLYRLGVTNQSLYSILCGEDIYFGSPLIDDKNIYVQFGVSLLALDKQNNQIVWQTDNLVRDGIKPYSVDDQRLYTTGLEGVWAWDKDTGEEIWYIDNKSYGHPFYEYKNLWFPVGYSELDYERGVLLSVRPQTGKVEEYLDLLPQTQFSQILYIDEQWILGVDHVEKPYSIFAVNRATKDVAWENTTIIELDSFIGVLAYDASNITLEDYNKNRIFELEIDSGEITKIYDVSYHKSISTAKTVNTVHISIHKDVFQEYLLYGIDIHSGDTIWSYKTYKDYPDFITVDNTVYFAKQNVITALDIQTGQLQWEVNVDAEYKYYWSGYPE